MLERLLVHPRVHHQGFDRRERIVALAAKLPDFSPFRGQPVGNVLVILDWDHRLPSLRLYLRVHLLYASTQQLLPLQQALAERTQEIAARSEFPEFDVADYAELPADEVYECELTPQLALKSSTLTSRWRGQIAPPQMVAAVDAVLRSQQLLQAQAEHPEWRRPSEELDPVRWVAPCESGHVRWTLEVWWMGEMDGRVGKGCAFLVDMEPTPRVIKRRPLNVQLGQNN